MSNYLNRVEQERDDAIRRSIEADKMTADLRQQLADVTAERDEAVAACLKYKEFYDYDIRLGIWVNAKESNKRRELKQAAHKAILAIAVKYEGNETV